MLTILGSNAQDHAGPTRREFLRFGTLATVAAATGAARAKGVSTSSFGRAKRCVFLFLTGGPPQLDLFDLKPQAPAEIRGEFRPIDTTVPGVQFGELLPRLAMQADKLCVVRSVTHADTVHTSAGYSMLTGVLHPLANSGTAKNIRPHPNDHPHLGSLLAKTRPTTDGLPAFVSLPEIIKDAAINEFPGQGAGFLGKSFDPFVVETEPTTHALRVPDIVLPADVSLARLSDRNGLLAQLNQTARVLDADQRLWELNGYYQRAFGLVRSDAVRRAFDLDHEPPGTRAAYGNHLFGQGCLLARRLLEAGVGFVTVYWHYEGPDDSPVWDTHGNNAQHLRMRLAPPCDQAVATLLAELAERGLLADTLLVVFGEFGRSPKINSQAGRDHWPHAQSVLFAGAGVRAGSIHGATDRHGSYPADGPLTPADFAATVLHLLGIPPDLELKDLSSRPLRAATGMPIDSIMG